LLIVEHVGAVGAQIDQHELVAPPLQPRMHSRRIASVDDQFVAGVAADRHDGPIRIHGDLTASIQQSHTLGHLGQFERGGQRDRRPFPAIPQHFENIHGFGFALHAHGPEPTRPGRQAFRKGCDHMALVMI
jgi:hypothetical protein